MAALGLTMQVVSFITDTATNSAIMVDNFRNYRARVAECRLRIEYCSTRLAAWYRVWHGTSHVIVQSTSLQTLHQALWGQDGYLRIVRQLEIIETLVKDICKALGINLNDGAYATLHGVNLDCLPVLPQVLEEAISASHAQYAKVPSRLKSAIYQFELLQKKFERAERNIKQLEELSCLLYEKTRCNSKMTSFHEADFNRLCSWHENIEQSMAIFCELHLAMTQLPGGMSKERAAFSKPVSGDSSRRRVETNHWGLELRVPYKPVLTTVRRPLFDYVVDFTVRAAENVCAGPIARRWRMVRPLNCIAAATTSQDIRDIARYITIEGTLPAEPHPWLARLPAPQSRSMSLKRHLLNIRAESRALQSRTGFGTQADDNKLGDVFAQNLVVQARADIALGLAWWTLSTWASPWLKDVCSCGLRSVIDERNDVHHVFWAESHVEHVCYEGPQACGPLFRLGVVLVELAVVRPLVVSSRYALRFHEGDDLMHRDGVLDMVRAKTDPVYASVVERCFELDERTAGRSLTVDDLRYLEEKVLKPQQPTAFPQAEKVVDRIDW